MFSIVTTLMIEITILTLSEINTEQKQQQENKTSFFNCRQSCGSVHHRNTFAHLGQNTLADQNAYIQQTHNKRTHGCFFESSVQE